jgi:hypothetical protein
LVTVTGPQMPFLGKAWKSVSSTLPPSLVDQETPSGGWKGAETKGKGRQAAPPLCQTRCQARPEIRGKGRKKEEPRSVIGVHSGEGHQEPHQELVHSPALRGTGSCLTRVRPHSSPRKPFAGSNLTHL